MVPCFIEEERTLAKKNNTFASKAVVLPKGKLVHVYLNTPDEYEGSVKYKAKVSVPLDDMDDLIAKMDAFEQEACDELGVKALPKRPWDDDEQTPGNVLIKTSCSGEYAPTLYDASGKKEMSRTIPIMGGSIGRLKSQMVAYTGFGGGISFSRLNGAQILELAERDSGFDEEDGYIAPDVADDVGNIQDAPVDDTPDAGDTDGNPDF